MAKSTLSPRGVKSRWNEKFTQKQVIDAITQTHGVMTLAAQLLGCSRDTVSRYRDTYPAVRQAVEQAPERVTDIAEGHLIKGVVNGNQEDVRWWLKTKGRDRGYGDSATTIVQQNNAVVVTIGDLDPETRLAISTLAKRLESGPSGNGGQVVEGKLAKG